MNRLEGYFALLTTRGVTPIKVHILDVIVNQHGSIQGLVDESGVVWNWANIIKLTPLKENNV